MMRMKTIGSQAYNTIKSEGKGFISGVTSAGTFIKTPSDKIIYLTYERFRGPLTINLWGDIRALDGIENEMQVIIDPGELSIPAIDLRIQVTSSEKWCAPLPEVRIRSPKERIETLNAFAAEILTMIGKGDFPEVVLWLGTLARGEELSGSEPGSMFNSLLHLQELTREGDASKAGEVCRKLLGRGEGLTPAGDDLLSGWLLSLNRWKEVLLPDIELQPLNEAIIQAAYEKTTTISANLIECATNGEGDERLLAVLDAIVCELGEQEKLLEDLLSWGSSSGAYAFCGMGVVITSG
jgi:hypothetical protein